jgi:hypothetical protein
MAKKSPDDVSIGKFDILATYTYAKALHDGLDDDEAKQRGMVAAVMGAKAKLGHTGGSHDDAYKADKQAAEKKKKTTITAESFERQVADKMGGFFEKTFLPIMKKLVKADLSYDEVKRLVNIPSTWGAKITGEQFEDRTAEAVGRATKGSTSRRKKRPPPGLDGSPVLRPSRTAADSGPRPRLPPGHPAPTPAP